MIMWWQWLSSSMAHLDALKEHVVAAVLYRDAVVLCQCRTHTMTDTWIPGGFQHGMRVTSAMDSLRGLDSFATPLTWFQIEQSWM